ELMTQNPMSTRGTWAATAVWIVTQSKAGPSGSHFASTCSPVHSESEPSRSPSRAISRMRAQASAGRQPSNSLKYPCGRSSPTFIASIRPEAPDAPPGLEHVERAAEDVEVRDRIARHDQDVRITSRSQ